MTRPTAERVVGWLAFGALLGAYALTSWGIFAATDPFYLFLNIGGSACMGYISLKNKVYPALVVDIFWFGLTSIGLVKAFF